MNDLFNHLFPNNKKDFEVWLTYNPDRDIDADEANVLGSFNNGNMLTVSTYDGWALYSDHKNTARGIASHRITPSGYDFEGLLYTKRLGAYLDKASTSPERKLRALNFANGLLLRGMNRFVNETLLEEVKHASDDSKLWFKTAEFIALKAPLLRYLAVGIDWLIPYESSTTTSRMIIFMVSFMAFDYIGSTIKLLFDDDENYEGCIPERRAKEFARKAVLDSRWNSIITITPKASKKDIKPN